MSCANILKTNPSVMFPTKNIFETEDMSRLFTSTQNDAVPPHYSLFQSPAANRSSSSAESVSPEYYFDLALQFNQDLSIRTRSSSLISPSPPKHTHFSHDFPPETPLCESPQPYSRNPFNKSPQIFDSPRSYHNTKNTDGQSQIWNQRPIYGRKILGGTSQVKSKENDFDLNMDWWQDSFTPPSSQPKSYELFPQAEGDFPNLPNRTSSISSSMSSMSSVNLPRSRTPMSNRPNTMHTQYNSNYSNFQKPPSQMIGQEKICTFCRKNGETPMVYTNHCVKEKVGGKYIVTCPILRSHKCGTCGVSGDDAHTLTYCPVLRRSNDGRPLPSTTITLKNTRIKSNGRRRY